MSDKYIEKAFLYLVALSVLLHAVIFSLIILFPQEKKVLREEPYMVELQDLPPVPAPPARGKREVGRLDRQRPKAPKELAPREELEREMASAKPTPTVQQELQPPKREAVAPLRPPERGEVPVSEKPRTGDFFRRKEPGVSDISKLYPSADKLAKLEESYRKKFEPEVEEGEARFLNTEDVQFGSFYRRLEAAVYGVWRYPPEAAKLGIEGVVPTRITFNRKGEIEKVEILESSGSRILDDEVRRALKLIGPIGSFPRAYDKDTFILIAFFHYRIVRGVIQGTLH